jgi:hypothetical protein
MKTIMMWGALGLVNFAVGNLFVGLGCVGMQLGCVVAGVAKAMDDENDDE